MHVVTPDPERPDLRMRVETEAGVLVVYDAPAPPQEGEEPYCSGFLVYWQSVNEETVYVFGSVVHDDADLAATLGALQENFEVDLDALVEGDARLAPAVTLVTLQVQSLGREPEDATPSPFEGEGRGEGSKVANPEEPIRIPQLAISWQPASLERTVEIMGFDPGDEDGPTDGSVALLGPPCYASAPPPENCGSPRALATEALRLVTACGGGGPPGGGGPSPPSPWNCPGDVDCDGIPNNSDPDLDGDGVPNGSDPDVDGDGINNGDDRDIDGDGTPNGSDPDMNNDGIDNGGDGDIDGDGIPNGSDPDPDGDGIPNADDGDDDSDSVPDPIDPEPIGCTAACPGACCKKSDGSCTMKKQADCAAPNYYYKGNEVPCSPNPCCVVGTNPVLDPNSATTSQVAPSMGFPGPCVLGLTWPEALSLGVSAICTGPEWCALLTSVKCEYSLQVRLLPGMTQIIRGPSGNTTQQNYCTQVENLIRLGEPCGGSAWYMIEAVKAHENVHLGHILPGTRAAVPAIEQSIESVCVPHSPGKTRNMAIEEMVQSQAFNTAFDNALVSLRAALRQLVDSDHTSGRTEQAEHEVVDPVALEICNRAENECWPNCVACLPRSTGGCCNPNSGACTSETRCDCEANGGTYKGNGFSCGPANPCVGACCGSAPPYPCILTVPGGCPPDRFGGLGTTCSPNPCGPPG